MSDILFQPLGQPVPAGEGLDHLADIDPRLTRTHYFDGRLLTAEDLTRDQIYLDQRLRELGKVLGSGVLRGLELAFDRFSGLLDLQPGQAITPLGRVLELGTPLQVNLGGRALMATLGNGKFRSFNRGLYAVVLSHVEVATDLAEVFPRDLGTQRQTEYAMVTEALQLGLVPLPLPLPQQSALQIRARLMRELTAANPVTSLLPDDSVTLGVLAIQNDTPQWLDAQLLRQPARRETALDDRQQDLSRQYEPLLADILIDRASRGLTDDFAASDYFSLLPPAGTLPRGAIDPGSGRQSYFPDYFNVTIAPIRRSDVALIKAESLPLPPIDLTSGEPVEIMVLAPLPNAEYGRWASQLEQDVDPLTRRLPAPDLLRLKLYPRHLPDTDQATWNSIWDRLSSGDAFYVRRPTRAAETAISAVVLARGSALPASDDTLPAASPADSGGLVMDETSLVLRYLNLPWLEQLRPADSASADAFSQLQEGFGQQLLVVQECSAILLRIERQYDSLIWPTLRALAGQNQLTAFREGLQALNPSSNTAQWIADQGADYGLDTTLLSQWADLT